MNVQDIYGNPIVENIVNHDFKLYRWIDGDTIRDLVDTQTVTDGQLVFSNLPYDDDYELEYDQFTTYITYDYLGEDVFFSYYDDPGIINIGEIPVTPELVELTPSKNRFAIRVMSSGSPVGDAEVKLSRINNFGILEEFTNNTFVDLTDGIENDGIAWFDINSATLEDFRLEFDNDWQISVSKNLYFPATLSLIYNHYELLWDYVDNVKVDLIFMG